MQEGMERVAYLRIIQKDRGREILWSDKSTDSLIFLSFDRNKRA